VASALVEHTAPSAPLDHQKARAAPTHPGAPPEPFGSSPWTQQLASGRRKVEGVASVTWYQVQKWERREAQATHAHADVQSSLDLLETRLAPAPPPHAAPPPPHGTPPDAPPNDAPPPDAPPPPHVGAEEAEWLRRGGLLPADAWLARPPHLEPSPFLHPQPSPGPNLGSRPHYNLHPKGAQARLISP
jgi:hypothetical protein